MPAHFESKVRGRLTEGIRCFFDWLPATFSPAHSERRAPSPNHFALNQSIRPFLRRAVRLSHRTDRARACLPLMPIDTQPNVKHARDLRFCSQSFVPSVLVELFVDYSSTIRRNIRRLGGNQMTS